MTIQPKHFSPFSGNTPLRAKRKCAVGGKKAKPVQPTKDVLESTCSMAEARAHMGIGETQLHALIFLGKKFCGLHPLKGGIYPTFKLSHKNRRIPISAIQQHEQHKLRLEMDAKFAAEMQAKARTVDNARYGYRFG
jgi:hypothetical protein